MRHCLTVICILAASLASLARAQTMPATQSTQPADFHSKLNLVELRALSLQDRQTIKTWDTYARQIVAAIAGKSSIDDQEPTFTVLDIAFRPEAYVGANILKIKNVPLRKDFATMPGIDPAEAKRILVEGTVSANFWFSHETQQYLQQIQQDAVWKSEAIAQVQNGAAALNNLMNGGPSLKPMAFIPPKTFGDAWLDLTQFNGNIASMLGDNLPEGVTASTPIAGYDDLKIVKLVASVGQLREAWLRGDSSAAQASIDSLVIALPEFSPGVYPSAAKRHVEVAYNKLFKLTLPGAALYFIAFTLFVIATYSQSSGLRRAGVAFMILGWLLHTVGIFIRWWLDQKSTGSWFYSIPIKNQFESVMMSAWFGVGVGLVLELWKKKSLFGAAACFVGWMSLIALFTVPYVFGKDIGGEIGRVNGILMSYWLYIHVTMATASYALIGMSFLLGVWWLIRFYTAPDAVQAMRANLLSADANDDEADTRGIATVARVASAFAGVAHLAGVGGASAHFAPGTLAQDSMMRRKTIALEPAHESVRALLARLDACNLVILQLAFWILISAIVCGAVWADVSWGRPWGWDPKETFALVTWMVYLVVIHVRLVTTDKAYWTAVLTVIGFFVMLFNWIGVNYFLVGLHSYA